MRFMLLLLPALLLLPSAGAHADSVLIDFEALDAPCLFQQTTALDQWGDARFGGAAGRAGGAILHECANFGSVARSGERFLALHDAARLADGRTPGASETITFSTLVKSFSIWAAAGVGNKDVSLTAFAPDGRALGRQTILAQVGLWRLLDVSFPATARVEIEVSGNGIAIFDDLSYTPVPEPSTLLLVAGGLAWLSHASARGRRYAR